MAYYRRSGDVSSRVCRTAMVKRILLSGRDTLSSSTTTPPCGSPALYKSYPSGNAGLFEFTGQPEGRGKFRVPTLRNIALTAPYMHDGSVATLEEVLDHYSAGGRTVLDGPHAGVGADNSNKSFFLQGFEATDEERRDLIEFLKSVTDPGVVSNPAFSDPWK